MKKFYLPIAILMMAVMLATTACSPTQIQAPTVKLGFVVNDYQSYDTVDMTTGFAIDNPNDFPIVISSLSYALTVNDILMANKTVTPMVVVPAKSSATVSTLNVVSIKDVITQYVLVKAMDTSTAAIAALPVWKLIGGALPLYWATAAAAGIMGGPPAGDAADSTKAANVLSTYATIKGGFDKTMGAELGVFMASPSGPTTYKAKGSMQVSAGNINLEVPLDLSWTKELPPQ